MSTIVLRSVKNSPLTNQEVDDNFSNLNTDKIQLGGTYSSGAASGVLFLNSSKVLTTGSALTFDGTNLKVASTQLRPTFLYLDNAGTSIGFAGAFSGYFGGATNNTYTLASYSGPIVFCTNAAEQMRLTSTGLGIGTSSPVTKLDVSESNVNAVTARITNTSKLNQYISISMAGETAFGNPGWDNSGIIEVVANDVVGPGTRALYLSAYNGPIIFATGNGSRNERMRLDSSGNLIQTVNTTAATLATNNTLTFSIVDNSTLRISVRGSDGTTRTATVALT